MPGPPPDAATASVPGRRVDVATGRVFTFEEVEIDLPGPLPLQWARSYSSSAAARDCGLG
ncbi:MAG: DUF6531 domain-containing protein [Polyangiaceae bacterium]